MCRLWSDASACKHWRANRLRFELGVAFRWMPSTRHSANRSADFFRFVEPQCSQVRFDMIKWPLASTASEHTRSYQRSDLCSLIVRSKTFTLIFVILIYLNLRTRHWSDSSSVSRWMRRMWSRTAVVQPRERLNYENRGEHAVLKDCCLIISFWMVISSSMCRDPNSIQLWKELWIELGRAWAACGRVCRRAHSAAGEARSHVSPQHCELQTRADAVFRERNCMAE